MTTISSFVLSVVAGVDYICKWLDKQHKDNKQGKKAPCELQLRGGSSFW